MRDVVTTLMRGLVLSGAAGLSPGPPGVAVSLRVAADVPPLASRQTTTVRSAPAAIAAEFACSGAPYPTTVEAPPMSATWTAPSVGSA